MSTPTKQWSAEAHAETLAAAWTSREWISDRKLYPTVNSVEQVYAIHDALNTNTKVVSQLGGLAGYKMGGIGAVPGEPAVYGTLFGCGLIPTLKDSTAEISKSQFNLFGIEAEVGFIMGSDAMLNEGQTEFTEADIFSHVKEIVLCLECCGRRHTLTDATNLENLADCSCSGGVILAHRFKPHQSARDGGVTIEQLASLHATISIDSVEKCSGPATANPLGSPVASLRWCANHLAKRQNGLAMTTEQLVIGGAMCKTQEFDVGSKIDVDFGKLGLFKVTVQA